MTRLTCFYTELDPRTRTALERYAPQSGLSVEWVETPGDQAYAKLLEERWTGEEDLILVEQDKEIFPGTLPNLMYCDQLWCACVYWIHPPPHTNLAIGGFGATKFSAAIQRQVAVSDFAGDGWAGIDRRFLDHLKVRGTTPCLHEAVLHHHVYEPRPEGTRRHVAALRAAGIVPPALYPEPADPGLLPGSYRLPGR